MTTTLDDARAVGRLALQPLPHPQGCRAWLLGDPASREALAVDVHLDQVDALYRGLGRAGWRLRWVVDTHTHADHPSAAGRLAEETGAVRVAHADSRHVGVTHHPDDEEPLALGDEAIVVRHAPGHTPDHLVLLTEGGAFSGDSLFIGSVARADFLGGDAGLLHDSIHRVLMPLDDDTALFPGHDYAGRIASTIGEERRSNPWLAMEDRDAFVRHLTESAPDEPANMAALLRFNREGEALPELVDGAQTVEHVRAGGAGTVIDVRTYEEVAEAHVPGARVIPLHELLERADEVAATPAPRLLLCRTGPRAHRAAEALDRLGLGGLAVVEGGIVAYAAAGGELEAGAVAPGPAAGGGCAAPSPGGGCSASPPPGA